MLDHLPDLALEVFTTLECEEPEIVDDLSLLVHDVVVVEQALTGFEVVDLDFPLSTLDRLGDEAVRDHLAFLCAHLIHHACDTLRTE